MNKNKKVAFVYWFAYYNLDSPSVRYRGKYPLNFLKKEYEVDSYFITPSYQPKKILIFLKAYFSALLFRKSNSIIVIQRINSKFIYATLLKFLIKLRPSQTFYDLDDADYLYHPTRSIFNFIKNCSGVFVGSRELVNKLGHLNSNIILNTSPTPDLQIYKKKKNPILTIGWVGDFDGGHKEALLSTFFPSLNHLKFELKLIILGVGRKHKNDFEFLKNYFNKYKNIHLEIPRNLNWNNENDIQKRISSFDVGIALLQNNEHQRSKSAFKLKQYLNNGVPVLSTDLPENNFFISDGINGFLCSNTEDFKRRLIQMNVMSHVEFMKLSLNARLSSKHFNLKPYCNTLLTGEGQCFINQKRIKTEELSLSAKLTNAV